MSNTEAPTAEGIENVAEGEAGAGVKARFAKAIEDAKAGAGSLGANLQEKAAPLLDKINTADIAEQAKAFGDQAKERAFVLANDGKAKTSDALQSLGKLVSDNVGLIDDNLGEKYGDYARTAARQIQEVAAKLESKDLAELGKDAQDFVKKNPGTALGAAAVIGFLLARSLKGGNEEA